MHADRVAGLPPGRPALMLLGVLLVVIFGVWGTNYDAQAFIYFQF